MSDDYDNLLARMKDAKRISGYPVSTLCAEFAKKWGITYKGLGPSGKPLFTEPKSI